MALFGVWKNLTDNLKEGDVSPGEKVILDACLAPIKKIVENAGKSSEVVINDLKKMKPEGGRKLGYNAATEQYVDMIEEGVIDPVKVTRTAFKNASSVAVTFLSLDAVIVEDRDEE